MGYFASVADHLGELLAGPGEIIFGLRGQVVTLGSANVKVTEQDTTARVEARQAAGKHDRDPRPGRLRWLHGRQASRERRRTAGHRPLVGSFSAAEGERPLRASELVQEIRGLTGLGWEGQAGPVWLGGHDRGLSFSFDTDVSFRRSGAARSR